MILKYKELTIETQRMWNIKTKVILVIDGKLEPSEINSENTLET
jgi:hypothetical protein